MVFIIYLLFFIIGIVFYEWIFPLIDSAVQLLLVHLEEKKNKVAVRITKIQSQLEKPDGDSTPAIGFPWIEEEEEELEDD